MDLIIVKVLKYLFIIKYCYVMLSYLLKIQLVIYYKIFFQFLYLFLSVYLYKLFILLNILNINIINNY